MGNPPTTDQQISADESDAYVVVDQRRIVLDMADSPHPAATLSEPDRLSRIPVRLAIARPPQSGERHR